MGKNMSSSVGDPKSETTRAGGPDDSRAGGPDDSRAGGPDDSRKADTDAGAQPEEENIPRGAPEQTRSGPR